MEQRRLNKDRQKSIQGKIADMMREAEPTPFAFEGPCRAGIRASLCLQGWHWGMADVIAADIVLAALGMVGARRPTWMEGQPEYTQPGALPIERERCKRCNKPLPEGHRKFCGRECGNAYNAVRLSDEQRERRSVMQRARMAAWSKKQPHRTCECCGYEFQPKAPKQRFCSPECVGHTYGGSRAPRRSA